MDNILIGIQRKFKIADFLKKKTELQQKTQYLK